MKSLQFSLIIFCLLLLILVTACVPPTNKQQVQTPYRLNTMSPSESQCDFANLTGYVHASNLINSIQGEVVLSNYTEQTCLLNSSLEIAIIDQTGKLIISKTVEVENKLVEANNYLSIEFFWENVCDSISSQSYMIQIKNNKPTQIIQIPIEDPNGNLILDHPSCKDESIDQLFLLQIYPIN